MPIQSAGESKVSLASLKVWYASGSFVYALRVSVSFLIFVILLSN
jgi:hypothetical protein